MNQQDVQFYEGSVLPKPKVYCIQHEAEITHGCTIQDCQHPFYCGSCTAHQHDQADPYASLKNIDQYIFDMSQRIRCAQLPFKSIYSQIMSNSENQNLIKWQVDLEPHFKNIENYVNAQKQLISSDVIQISNKVYEILDIQRQQIFRKLDDFLMNYKIQFGDFKHYHDHIFQLLQKKYRYIGDCNSLSGKLNSLDSHLSHQFLIQLRESLNHSESLINNSALHLHDIEKVFKDINNLTTKLPNYKQLADFEVVPPIQGQSSIKVIDQIKVQIEGHFKEACINFYLPPQKLSIPPNQMPAKKTINFLQSYGRNSQNNVYSDNMLGSNKQQSSVPSPNLPQYSLQHSNSQPNGTNSIQANSYQSVNNPNFFGQTTQFDGLATSQNKTTKLKIFQKQGSMRNQGSLNSPSAGGLINQAMLSSNNQNGQFGQPIGNIPVLLQRQNTYGMNVQFQTQSSTNLNTTQIMQQQSPAPILNSQYLKLKKEFQIKLTAIPKFMCYLTNGYIAMAVQNECLRILDTNNNTIIQGKQLIMREIKFLASLQPTSEGLYSSNQPNVLNFALSNIDSVIMLYSFNCKTREIIQKNSSIVGFSSPVTRIVDLYPICHCPLLAAGDENGEVSVFDYDKTNGYGLEKCHQTAITQLMVVSTNNNKYTSIQSQLNYQPSKFISFSSEDQVLVLYSYAVDKFQKVSIFNVSNIGGGLLYLRNHPEFEQFIAVCKNSSLRVMKFENKNIIDQLIEQRARDIAVFSVKESLNGGSEYVAQQDHTLSGLVFTSEQESDKLGLLKTTYTSPVVQKEQILSTILSPRKILYVDNKNRLFIMINDFNNFIQVYDIKA